MGLEIGNERAEEEEGEHQQGIPRRFNCFRAWRSSQLDFRGGHIQIIDGRKYFLIRGEIRNLSACVRAFCEISMGGGLDWTPGVFIWSLHACILYVFIESLERKMDMSSLRGKSKYAHTH